MKAISFLLLIASLGLVAVGCGDRPQLKDDDVSRMTFNTFYRSSTPVTRTASAAEIDHFVAAYSKAAGYDDKAGTTHPARVDIVLTSGSRLLVWGGGEGVPDHPRRSPPLEHTERRS